MPLRSQHIDHETASARRLEALLAEAMAIADLLGLGLTAIRIEEAATAMGARNADTGCGAFTLLN